MGSTNFKVTYKCDCGQDYGSCDRRSFFLLRHNRTSDFTTIFWKHHADEPNSKMEFIGVFDDNAIAALTKVLNQAEPDERWSEEDEKQVKQLR